MADSVWHVNPSTILLQGKELSVSDFSIRRGNEYLSVRGKISQDPQEKLLINLENFNLENLARITFKKRLTLFGIATGSLSLQDYYKDFILLTDFFFFFFLFYDTVSLVAQDGLDLTVLLSL